MRRSPMFKVGFVIIAIVFVLTVIYNIAVEYQDAKDGCKPTGEQRLVNSIMNTPNGAMSGLAVEDKFICKTGRITWKQRYN